MVGPVLAVIIIMALSYADNLPSQTMTGADSVLSDSCLCFLSLSTDLLRSLLLTDRTVTGLVV